MKAGIDFFPLEVVDDRKLKLIKAEYGLVGCGVVVELWRMIYREEGYYVVWDNDVALVFAQDNRVGPSVVSEVVNSALKRDIFDKGIFDRYGVLTSHGIQKRYLDACSRRVSVKIEKRYLLLSASEIPKNVNILSENVNISSKNVNRNGQSKVKESKVKESIYSSSSASRLDGVQKDFDEFWNVYPKKKAKADALKAWKKLNPSAELKDTILKAVIHQRQTHDWTKDGGKYIPLPATWLNGQRWTDEDTEVQGSFDTDDFAERSFANAKRMAEKLKEKYSKEVK